MPLSSSRSSRGKAQSIKRAKMPAGELRAPFYARELLYGGLVFFFIRIFKGVVKLVGFVVEFYFVQVSGDDFMKYFVEYFI